MANPEILALLRQVQTGELTPEEAVLHLKLQPFEDLGYAKVDHHRAVRQGTTEVIYGEGKTAGQIAGILKSLRDGGQPRVLVTRLSPQKAQAVDRETPIRYFDACRIGLMGEMPDPTGTGTVVVCSGGTSDMAVSEEAAITAQALGSRVERLYDVGVAGIHRLLAHLDLLSHARAVIAVAGMEGALASVVGGLVDCPVIAVPTSVGYGANFGGLSALLSMLNSCASGVSVVNIDNGFGAGYLANIINHLGAGEDSCRRTEKGESI